MRLSRRRIRAVVAGGVATCLAFGTVAFELGGSAQAEASTRSPIQHVVVIFQENVSFDHYFGTYPNATNTSGEPFYPSDGTPSVDGLSGSVLTDNPNGANPRRLDPSNINDLLLCDQDHGYTDEQTAFDGGKMDKFVQVSDAYNAGLSSPTGQPCQGSDVMNYYDGNTVTALWNYAQHFAMSDNSYGTTFGPSAPGAINLVAGDTDGAVNPIRGAATDGDLVPDGKGGSTLINDAQPYYDNCSGRDAVAMSGQNIGDELNAAGLSWGWFEGGFGPTTPYTGPADSVASYNPLTVTGRAVCGASHPVGAALGGTGQWGTKSDYIPHHEPFQFYASTANPHHLAPTSLSAVGTDTATPGEFNTANHQYDMSWFTQLVAAIHDGTMPPSALPAVTFLKAPGYEDGHAGYSDPIDEQNFVVNTINSLEQLPDWSSTAVIISYDDSDGFYDHVFHRVTNASATTADTLNGPGVCGHGRAIGGEQGRCGPGPRLPLMVISPWAKTNFVATSFSDQSSIIKFVQWNWRLPPIKDSAANTAGPINNMFNFGPKGGNVPPLYLSPSSGEPALIPSS